MQFQVLGPLTAFQDQTPIPIPGSRKSRALLAYLLLQGRPVSREHLCEMLWPHPDDPRAALRWSLTKLRPLLNAHRQHLLTDRATVQVCELTDAVDLIRIETLLRTPIRDIETDTLKSAAADFQGELLEGLEIPDCHRFNQWLLSRGETARKSRRTILETLTARLANEPEEALVYARQRVLLDPLDEAAHVATTRLLMALGRVAEARDQAQNCRTILREELAAQPGPELAAALRETKAQQPIPPKPGPPPARPIVQPHEIVGPGLFGRAEECIAFEEFLAADDWPRILFLDGEPGIGKSRLLLELQKRCAQQDILFLKGRSWEVEVVRPYGVWIEMLAGLSPELVPVELHADLSSLRPDLVESPQYAVPREKVLSAVRRLITHIGRAGHRLVLAFDDIQWLDQASVELLNSVAAETGHTHLGIACAGRAGELADNGAVRSLVRSWTRAGVLTPLPLSPLSEPDATALVRSLAAETTAAPIVAACGGNPLFLIESAREGSGAPRAIAAGLAIDRMSVFDPPTLAIAEWAAVFGHAFAAAVLADVLDQPLTDFLQRTETLERHGIFSADGDHWDFAHGLVRRSTLAQISGPRRTLMHRRIARTLAAEPGLTDTHAADVSFHAARCGESLLAATSSIAAGDRALRLAAYEDAARLAERGLVALSETATAAHIESKVGLHRVLVLANLGRGLGQTIITQLSELATQAQHQNLPSVERTARWLLSIVTEESGDFDSARRHSLSAEKASRSADPHTRLQALANTARCLVQLEHEPIRAAELLAEAQTLAEMLNSRVLDIPWGEGILHAMAGREEDARAAFEKGAALAQQQENHWAHFECLAKLSMLDLTAGKLIDLESRHSELLKTAERLGEGSERALATALYALSRHKAGDPNHNLGAAISELRAADAKGLLAYVLVEAGEIEFGQGNVNAAAACAEDALLAATEVSRHHQYDRAMRLSGRIALAAGETEQLNRYVQWLEKRRDQLRPEIPFHAELLHLGNEISNPKRST